MGTIDPKVRNNPKQRFHQKINGLNDNFVKKSTVTILSRDQQRSEQRSKWLLRQEINNDYFVNNDDFNTKVTFNENITK